jgi:hypothetical protein
VGKRMTNEKQGQELLEAIFKKEKEEKNIKTLQKINKSLDRFHKMTQQIQNNLTPKEREVLKLRFKIK